MSATKPVLLGLGEAGIEAVEACSAYLEKRVGLAADLDARDRLRRRLAFALAEELAQRMVSEMARRAEDRLWSPPREA
jgi:hypothetical protein